MTKSKNKIASIVALIAMVILLAASVALGVTGAWFTAKASANTGAVDLTWGTVGVTISASELQVSRNGGAFEKATPGMIVMPGDKVKGGVYTATIVTKDKAGVYYLIHDGSKYYTVSGNNLTEYTSGNLTAVAVPSGAEGTITLTWGGINNETTYVGGSDGASTANSMQGTTVAAGTAGTCTIYVIQASNIDASEAGQKIKDLVSGGFPANKAA